jgi:hypothetical protein
VTSSKPEYRTGSCRPPVAAEDPAGRGSGGVWGRHAGSRVSAGCDSRLRGIERVHCANSGPCVPRLFAGSFTWERDFLRLPFGSPRGLRHPQSEARSPLPNRCEWPPAVKATPKADYRLTSKRVNPKSCRVRRVGPKSPLQYSRTLRSRPPRSGLRCLHGAVSTRRPFARRARRIPQSVGHRRQANDAARRRS